MAFDYQSMRTMATGLLGEFGNRFTLRKQIDKPIYDPKTKKTTYSFTSHDGTCVMKTYSDETMGLINNIIEAGDVAFVCTMDDISITPLADKDKVIFNNIVYNIIRVSTSNPSGQLPIVHTLQCRRAGV